MKQGSIACEWHWTGTQIQGRGWVLGAGCFEGLILATDDLAARGLTRDEGVRLTGTLGIPVALVRGDDLPLSRANGVLRAMIQSRYRSPVDRAGGAA